jgi:hypothetical protein
MWPIYSRIIHREQEAGMALERHHTMIVEEYFQLEENDPDTLYEYVK